MISTRSTKRGVIEVYPKFLIKKSSDLMVRGGDFYAIWIEERGLWSTDEQDALSIIDSELDKYAKENKSKFEGAVHILHMWDADSGMIDRWHKYCQKQMRDSFHMLDEKLIFSNTPTSKKDYASKKLSYPLENGEITAYEKLMSVLYSEEERIKIEWAIGAIVSGKSTKLQKFLVLYGAAGTGKSTILNIIQQLFEGYYSVFDARALGSSSNSFALEAFKNNPLVAIQHDGDLSRIEDNTRLNSLVSHEMMTVNEKFKSAYSNRFKSFLFMGTNKPVKITDAKSGLIRRLIDVSPSGNKVGLREYKTLTKQIEFELGAIAQHCKDLYLVAPDRYDGYIPITMLGASNDFYNFVLDSYYIFKKENGVTLKAAWETYKTYCDDAKVLYPYSQRIFKEELRNYFEDYKERHYMDDGTRARSYYVGFKTDKFESDIQEKPAEDDTLIKFRQRKSIFDEICGDCFAQYATSNETPSKKWNDVKTKLAELDTSRLHYVKVPENHIVIDFDIVDEKGDKSLKKNIEEASKWPPTYSEISKGGSGVHLHYIFSGDPATLSRSYADHIEIKVFRGKASLRRKLTKCNDLQIAMISSGLPLKGGDKMVNFDTVKSEKGLRSLVKRNLNKEIHPGTKPSIDFINKILEDTHKSGLKYDLTDMRNAVLAFAASSTNQSDYCIKLVNRMKFKSDDNSDLNVDSNAEIIFYDVEVFPNLLLVNWKKQGKGKKVVRMINPTPTEIETLLDFKLVGFNCRRYDNHILYAVLMGYSNEQLYNLSKKIVTGSKNCYFGEAYNLSYTDVYDFTTKKQSLKKWEIELGIHHQELGLPWDEPVSEDLWEKVAEYCDNDVIATEATFDACKSDFLARQILADLAGGSVNDTTNTLTTKIIFGTNRKPQDQFNYRDMGIEELPFDMTNEEYTLFDASGRPIFPGYIYEKGKSIYRGEEVGEGGYVYAEPGIYGNVALLDIVSMHPTSVVNENLFGDEYTDKFNDILGARIAIKRKEFDKARKLFNGKLQPYLKDENVAKDLAQALKIAINSVYGLTSAKFDNAFRDNRNIDNIVAKRGALFMINLKHIVQEAGFTVAHIKTDSIKIPDATPEIIELIRDYGKKYGYEFEHEATYDRMCLVNYAVYIAKHEDGDWTATGTQFAVPYVFKTLFSKEKVIFEDLCETKSVTTSIFLDLNEGLVDVADKEKELSKLESDYKKGLLSDTTFEPTAQRLVDDISQGHNYRFIGKIGLFCPIKPDCGGGLLMREKDSKYDAVTGTKGYRWLEAEMVKELKLEDNIDISYYEQLAHKAKGSIIAYGDFDWFVSDKPYVSPGYIDGKPVYLEESVFN